MSFAEKIDKHISKMNVLTMGEVRIYRAYLYAKNYEIVIQKLAKRKVMELEIYDRNEKTVVLRKIGTLNHLLSIATGYVMHH